MRTSLGSFWVKCLVGAVSVGAWASVANAQKIGGGVTRDMVAPDKKAEAEAREAAAESIVARSPARKLRRAGPSIPVSAPRSSKSLLPEP